MELNKLETIIGQSKMLEIKNHISQSATGYEVKLEPVYNNNKIVEIKIFKLIGQKASELEAIKFENELRREQGLKERASYQIYGR